MSLRFHYWLYGLVITAVAIGIGLVTRWLLEFHWMVISVMLLVIMIVLIRSNSYQREEPMKQMPSNESGATLVRAALSGQGNQLDERTRVATDHRFKWVTEPLIAALITIIAGGILL